MKRYYSLSIDWKTQNWALAKCNSKFKSDHSSTGHWIYIAPLMEDAVILKAEVETSKQRLSFHDSGFCPN